MPNSQQAICHKWRRNIMRNIIVCSRPDFANTTACVKPLSHCMQVGGLQSAKH